MKSFFSIVRYDYLQRTRSYAFLITLCASLALAYTFVPEPNASYSTIRISDYIGYYNASWFGYVTAIMTSIFLSLIGFYLVNSGIKADNDTRVGQIVATTPIKNLSYLMGKATSNFAVLFTIVCCVFFMSAMLFFLYNDGYPFELLQFVKPYLLVVLPPICFISTLAVVFEVLLGRYSVIQNIAFFFLFTALALPSPLEDTHFMTDVFGSKIVTQQMITKVNDISNTTTTSGLNIGYVLGNSKESKRFLFEGVDFSAPFILSRILWMLGGVFLLVLIAPFFHRFDGKRLVKAKKDTAQAMGKNRKVNEVMLSALPAVQADYSIVAFVKTEVLLLCRHGKRWLWLINLGGMVLLSVLPIAIAHQYVLPILWFLQVGRLSELNTKEITYGLHYLAFTSFKPMRRLLFSQLLSGILLVVSLSAPLLIRYVVASDFVAVASIAVGGVFIVLLAAALGILSKGKKLFEILFFMITYTNINGLAFTDYFGGMPHGSFYVPVMALLCLLLGMLGLALRYLQLRR